MENQPERRDDRQDHLKGGTVFFPPPPHFGFVDFGDPTPYSILTFLCEVSKNECSGALADVLKKSTNTGMPGSTYYGHTR